MAIIRIYLTRAAHDSLPTGFPGLVREEGNAVAYLEANAATVSDDGGWLRVVLEDHQQVLSLPPTAVAAVVRK